MGELRFCNHCLQRVEHEILEDPNITMRKAKAFYQCTNCGRKSWKRHLRPSSEISY
ncbi:MAG: hypothetical protein HYY67_07285 [Thaumarchaeota archaeon]|nr:hypothetical protein [Nitrososphaerota archaeon]